MGVCSLALTVSNVSWFAATWIIPGACKDSGKRNVLRQHACAQCPAWPVRDVPARGESTGQSGRGTAGRLGKANRAFAFAVAIQLARVATSATMEWVCRFGPGQGMFRARS